MPSVENSVDLSEPDRKAWNKAPFPSILEKISSAYVDAGNNASIYPLNSVTHNYIQSRFYKKKDRHTYLNSRERNSNKY